VTPNNWIRGNAAQSNHQLVNFSTSLYSVSTNKQSQLLKHSVVKPLINALIFLYNDLRNSCESGDDYVFRLTCVMSNFCPYLVNVSDRLHFGNKQNSQTMKRFTQH